MFHPIPLTTKLPSARTSVNWSSQRPGLPLFLLVLMLPWLALLQPLWAVSPPPDGGYPNENTAEGDDALFSLTSGVGNTALGNSALFLVTTGSDNTAVGWAALYDNTTGFYNTANGVNALSYNTASNNTATGYAALVYNTTGSNNTANGYFALQGSYPMTGSNNTANGAEALLSNTTGTSNTANGFEALLSNTTGGTNTANGKFALFSNLTGGSNMASGVQALFHNTSGGNNLADGVNALFNNTTGGNNLAFGTVAGFNLTTGSNNIEIGNMGVAAEANTIRLGTVGTQQATYIAGISGKTVAGGVGVIIDTNGHLGTVVSSARFKDNVQPMDKTSEAILALKPVTFRYKHELDPDGIPQFGLVAEQVETGCCPRGLCWDEEEISRALTGRRKELIGKAGSCLERRSVA